MGYIAGRSPIRFLTLPPNYNGLAGLLRGLGDCSVCTDTADDGSCLEYDTSGCTSTGGTTTPATTTPDAPVCYAAAASECDPGDTWVYSASPFNATSSPSTDSGTGPIYVMGSSAGCAPGYVIGQVVDGGNSPGQCIAAPAGSVGSSLNTAGAIASITGSTESLISKIVSPQVQMYNAAGQLIYSGPASGAPLATAGETTLTSSNLLLYGGLALAAVLLFSMMKK